MKIEDQDPRRTRSRHAGGAARRWKERVPQRYLASMARFHRYTANNILLIHATLNDFSGYHSR